MSTLKASCEPYPVAAVVRARAMREAGWSFPKVQQFIRQEFGRRPSLSTLYGWCDEEIAERRRRLIRQAHRAQRKQQPQYLRHSEDWKDEQLRKMVQAGLSTKQAGIVAGIWWGERLAAGQVRSRIGYQVSADAA